MWGGGGGGLFFIVVFFTMWGALFSLLGPFSPFEWGLFPTKTHFKG